MPKLRLTFVLALTPLALVGCTVSADGPQCNGGKCDNAGDFGSTLDGHDDPIAKFLREAGVDADGQVKADYGAIARGVAGIQGCGEETWKTFVVSDKLVEGQAFPRLISTVCSDDPTHASEFFIAASFKDPAEDDVDPRTLEMFAWDATAGIYRFYASERVGKDAIKVEIDPARCKDCHLTPQNLKPDGMRMTPIMNELTQPWSHWNSQVPMFNAENNPFPSHQFDVPNGVRTGNDFMRYGRDRIGAATDFEQIIRAGHARVTGERAKERRGTAADYKEAMNLLRPLFCEEQVQYTTEDFNTGLLQSSAVIPGGVREAYRAIRPDNWPWDWMNSQDGRMRLAAPATVPPLFMVPVRGNVDTDFENRLLSVRAMTPAQILRIRALDWKHAVFSDFRCGLWTGALARFEKSPPKLGLSGKVVDQMKLLYGEIMKLDGAVSLDTGSEDSFIALDDATTGNVDALKKSIGDGSLATACGADGAGACKVNVDGFGAMLDGFVRSFEQASADDARTRLLALRDQRLCHVMQFFKNAPELPDNITCK